MILNFSIQRKDIEFVKKMNIFLEEKYIIIQYIYNNINHIKYFNDFIMKKLNNFLDFRNIF